MVSARLLLKTSTLVVAGLVAQSSLAVPFVFPTGADTSTQARASVNTNASATSNTVLGGTTAATSATASGSTAHASANMPTGQLKVDGSSTYGVEALANGWEFVTFSGTGSVNFSYTIDGTLKNANPSGLVAIDAAVRIYDATTWTGYFYNSFGTLVASPNGAGASPFPYIAASDFDNEGVQGTTAATNGLCALQFINTCSTDQIGTEYAVNLLLDGVLNAVVGKLYLIELSASTYTFNPISAGSLQVSDFSNTATFRFTNLNGLTFESASGQFLQAVPEPVTLTLFGLGLAGLGWSRRKKA